MVVFLSTLVVAAAPEARRESSLDFVADEALQSRGGLQYFLELAKPEKEPLATSPLARFRALDPEATADDPYFVVVSRLVYTIDKDISFFTEARARDLNYVRAIVPDMGIEADGDGFVVTRTPKNHFVMTWFDAPVAGQAKLKSFLPMVPGNPASVILQRNDQFSRVMGWKTAERSLTYTAHLSLGPGKTRIWVCSLSLLHHVPPFFLGGEGRVISESVANTTAVIERIRAYREP